MRTLEIEKILLIISVIYIILTVGILTMLYGTMEELKKLLKEFINKLDNYNF